MDPQGFDKGSPAADEYDALRICFLGLSAEVTISVADRNRDIGVGDGLAYLDGSNAGLILVGILGVPEGQLELAALGSALRSPGAIRGGRLGAPVIQRDGFSDAVPRREWVAALAAVGTASRPSAGARPIAPSA
jgi:hypothetical protein